MILWLYFSLCLGSWMLQAIHGRSFLSLNAFIISHSRNYLSTCIPTQNKYLTSGSDEINTTQKMTTPLPIVVIRLEKTVNHNPHGRRQ